MRHVRMLHGEAHISSPNAFHFLLLVCACVPADGLMHTTVGATGRCERQSACVGIGGSLHTLQFWTQSMPSVTSSPFYAHHSMSDKLRRAYLGPGQITAARGRYIFEDSTMGVDSQPFQTRNYGWLLVVSLLPLLRRSSIWMTFDRFRLPKTTAPCPATCPAPCASMEAVEVCPRSFCGSRKS